MPDARRLPDGSRQDHPRLQTPGEDELLASCYRNSLALVEQHGIKTVAFPSISTGAYGFPMERAARIAVSEVKKFLQANRTVEKVLLVCFGKAAYKTHQQAVKEIAG
jgi:O-acetyl-ADP-ribose deacetylase (regulator of RNase III)